MGTAELKQLADELDAFPREGTLPDEPEGKAWITVSDTFLRLISRHLRQAADTIEHGTQL